MGVKQCFLLELQGPKSRHDRNALSAAARFTHLQRKKTDLPLNERECITYLSYAYSKFSHGASFLSLAAGKELKKQTGSVVVSLPVSIALQTDRPLGTMTEEDLYFSYKGIYLPKAVHTPESLKYFEEFTFRPEDVIIATYPKSGKS